MPYPHQPGEWFHHGCCYLPSRSWCWCLFPALAAAASGRQGLCRLARDHGDHYRRAIPVGQVAEAHFDAHVRDVERDAATRVGGQSYCFLCFLSDVCDKPRVIDGKRFCRVSKCDKAPQKAKKFGGCCQWCARPIRAPDRIPAPCDSFCGIAAAACPRAALAARASGRRRQLCGARPGDG